MDALMGKVKFFVQRLLYSYYSDTVISTFYICFPEKYCGWKLLTQTTTLKWLEDTTLNMWTKL